MTQNHTSEAPPVPQPKGWLARGFHEAIIRYLSLYVREDDWLFDVRPMVSLAHGFKNYRVVHDLSAAGVATLPPRGTASRYWLLNGLLHYDQDVQARLAELSAIVEPDDRLIVVYYSSLWRPLLRMAGAFGWRMRTPEQSWISHSDTANFLVLSRFEPIRRDARLLCPIPIPGLAWFLNTMIAPLAFFRWFTLVNVLVARPTPRAHSADPRPSVSIVVPARNESGNIADILRRCPQMGPEDELIFVEGNSADDTWATIEREAAAYRGPLRLQAAHQDGRGKGDAVRKGFGLARNDVLMILDADLTVPPEDLPKFYDAIRLGLGEFINGSRLVYPRDDRAMRFLNLLANKFFAVAFTYALGQEIKDTLCGTKVIRRADYARLAAHRAYFGDFDPFGDFDLLFGAARLGLKTIEVPIRYRERTYGTTNIQRWRHGLILLRMLLVAVRKFRFL
jgi:hypothetical protein